MWPCKSTWKLPTTTRRPWAKTRPAIRPCSASRRSTLDSRLNEEKEAGGLLRLPHLHVLSDARGGYGGVREELAEAVGRAGADHGCGAAGAATSSAMTADLILKCASASRLFYDVLENGVVVGRIFCAGPRKSRGRPFLREAPYPWRAIGSPTALPLCP